VAVLERVAARCGLPQVIQVDNGSEFTSRALDAWPHRHGVKLAFTRPGASTDIPFIEAFNERVRAECPDQKCFASLEEARNDVLPEFGSKQREKERTVEVSQEADLYYEVSLVAI
jgi:transposase InsO family protein